MKTLGIYEVKTKMSEICEAVKETREPVLVTKRGRPLVRIEPVEDAGKTESTIWNAREHFIRSNGPIQKELGLPERTVEPFENPMEE